MSTKQDISCLWRNHRWRGGALPSGDARNRLSENPQRWLMPTLARVDDHAGRASACFAAQRPTPSARDVPRRSAVSAQRDRPVCYSRVRLRREGSLGPSQERRVRRCKVRRVDARAVRFFWGCGWGRDRAVMVTRGMREDSG